MKRDVHGVVLLDKAQYISSNKALQQVRHCFKAKKAGHTGSLDPLATGLLPICLGQATKVCSYLLDSQKSYQATIKLGVVTDTYDAQGEVTQTREVAVSQVDLQNALPQFLGAIKQVPPMYSALKKAGQPLYKLARQGIELERPARNQYVYELDAKLVDSDLVELNVRCDSGFYVRSLAYDLGVVLGCGAHIVKLRRTAIKQIKVDQANSIEQVQENPDAALLPIDTLLADMPVFNVTEQQALALLQGKLVQADSEAQSGVLRFVREDGELFAIGSVLDSGLLKTHRIFIFD